MRRLGITIEGIKKVLWLQGWPQTAMYNVWGKGCKVLPPTIRVYEVPARGGWGGTCPTRLADGPHEYEGHGMRGV
jgi:hypothetical protein